MQIPPLLLDTCVVLSLYASRRIEEILGANVGPFLVAEAVLRESLYIQAVVDGVREKEPIDLEPLVTGGVVAPIAPDTEEEFQTLIDLSRQLDDGEAMTCAIALHRGYRIATDEKKTIKLVGDRIPIVGTLDLLRAWADVTSVPPATLRDVFMALAERAYIPGTDHLHRAWWDQILNNTD